MNKNGKIIFIIIVVIVNVLILGYYLMLKNPKGNAELENKMTKASESYFEKYVSTTESASVYTVTLDALEKANSQGESYDLKGLENCDKEKTTSKITINYKNGKPKKVEVELKC